MRIIIIVLIILNVIIQIIIGLGCQGIKIILEAGGSMAALTGSTEEEQF